MTLDEFCDRAPLLIASFRAATDYRFPQTAEMDKDESFWAKEYANYALVNDMQAGGQAALLENDRIQAYFIAIVQAVDGGDSDLLCQLLLAASIWHKNQISELKRRG